ncbi:hypothetical protein BMQ_pBM50020 (plasmid) [Priestia megaterium QM B1551]|uniref:Uncharacterized protein n=1 Tax=Priestia megaterium (strain ATCC 12872 / QMB1551) TaxID=545693 RepID=D5E3I4_PRIM1|nr:hypothetical protein BMQ_pBM50020 [Priestia megaterium QM B1551]
MHYFKCIAYLLEVCAFLLSGTCNMNTALKEINYKIASLF